VLRACERDGDSNSRPTWVGGAERLVRDGAANSGQSGWVWARGSLRDGAAKQANVGGTGLEARERRGSGSNSRPTWWAWDERLVERGSTEDNVGGRGLRGS